MPRNLDRIEFDNLVKRMEVQFDSLGQYKNIDVDGNHAQKRFNIELNYLVEDIELFYRKY